MSNWRDVHVTGCFTRVVVGQLMLPGTPSYEIHQEHSPGDLGRFNFVRAGFAVDSTEAVVGFESLQREEVSLWICTCILAWKF